MLINTKHHNTHYITSFFLIERSLIVRIKSIPLRTTLEAFGVKKNTFLRFLVWQNRSLIFSSRNMIFVKPQTLKSDQNHFGLTGNIKFSVLKHDFCQIITFKPLKSITTPNQSKTLPIIITLMINIFTISNHQLHIQNHDSLTIFSKTQKHRIITFKPWTYSLKLIETKVIHTQYHTEWMDHELKIIDQQHHEFHIIKLKSKKHLFLIINHKL